MRYSKQNFHTLLRIMYEFTGNQFYLRSDLTCDLTWFYELKNKIKEMVKCGEVCKYNLINFATKQKTPFTINRITL